MSQMYCIGDSHVSVFLGREELAPIYPESKASEFPIFNVIRIGPITAYNISNPNSSSGAKPKIENILKNEIPPKSTIIFSAGEIDIRVHLIKQSEKNNRSIEEVCNECVDKYINQLKEYALWGFKIIVMSPPPAAFIEENDPDYPKYGTEKERNNVTKIFTSYLQKRAQEADFIYIDIFNSYVNDENLTKRAYLWDGVHPSAIVLFDVFKQLKNSIGIDYSPNITWKFFQYLKQIKKYYERRN